jgi:hypothetical protein
VLQKLKASGAVELVDNAAQADAVLHGDATIWLSSYVSMSPRSKAAEQALYRGFASAEMTGKDGRTLWSYLVTPRSSGWKNITDDLGDQLAQALLSALEKKEPGDAGPTGASTAAAGGFGLSITNARGRHTYPIATFTWLLLPEDGTDAVKKTAPRDLSRWMLTAGQKQCQEFGYSPLPPEFASRELHSLSALN